jgi:hypothetical protein
MPEIHWNRRLGWMLEGRWVVKRPLSYGCACTQTILYGVLLAQIEWLELTSSDYVYRSFPYFRPGLKLGFDLNTSLGS